MLSTALIRRRLITPSFTGLRLNRRRRARSSLIAGVVIFMAANLGLGIYSESNLRIRDPYYGDKLVRLIKKMHEPNHGPAVVMLGSSRAGFAFHGYRIEERARRVGRSLIAFNFGVPATGPVTHLLYLKRMIEDGARPDYLLIELLPSMFVDAPDGPREHYWLFADRLKYEELTVVEKYGFDSATIHSRWRESTLLPWYGLRFQLLGRVIQSWIPWQLRYDWSRGTDACGWGTPYKEVLTEDERKHALTKAHDEYYPVLSNWMPGELPTQALHELIVYARSTGIEVKLILLPEGSRFRSWYSPAARERLRTFVSRLECDVIDAQMWLEDDDFTDDHHQLRRGAEKFSDRLTDEILVPWLNGTR